MVGTNHPVKGLDIEFAVNTASSLFAQFLPTSAYLGATIHAVPLEVQITCPPPAQAPKLLREPFTVILFDIISKLKAPEPLEPPVMCKLPTLPKNSIKVKIVTGLEALGRSSDLQRLNTFIQQLTPFAQELFKYVNFDEYVKRVGTSLGIDMEGLIKPPEQLQMEEQIAQQQAKMQQATPVVTKEGAGIVRDSFKARGEQQQLEQEQQQGQ